MRHRPHRIGSSVLLVAVLASCVRSSSAAVETSVAGVNIAREAPMVADRDRPLDDDRPVDTPVSNPVSTPGSTPEATPPVAVVTVPVPADRPAGDRMLTQNVGGIDRQWIVVVPPGTKEGQRLPMLVVLHGVGGRGGAMRHLGFEKLAAASGTLVLYPDATGGSWNDGRPGMEPLSGTPTDDVAFLRVMIARTATDVGGDASRVSLAGFSNGALMASRAACDMTDVLSAVVLVAGAGPRDMAQRCKPSRPLPIMVVFGTADPTVPYDGGQVASASGKSRGQVASVREMLDVWRTANGCTSADTQEVVSSKPAIVALRGGTCRADLVHYKVSGGTHEWINNPNFDTTATAWGFVVAHSA